MAKTTGLVSICLLLVCNLANCQMIEPSTESPKLQSYDFHIKKFKSNRTTGNILIITGSACFVTGLIINIADTPNAIVDAAFEGEGTIGTDLGTGLMAGGAIAALASIPFHLKAKEHKKKADLLLGTTQAVLGNIKVNMPKNIGVSLIIPIN